MRHTPKNSITENMHGLLKCIFVDYANELRIPVEQSGTPRYSLPVSQSLHG